MANFNKGDFAVHPEFGKVEIMERISAEEGNSVSRNLLKAIGDTGTYYMCGWVENGAEQTAVVRECLLEPAANAAETYERDAKQEDDLVEELLEGFDFESTVKAVKIMEVVDPENYGFYDDIAHFKSADALMTVAEESLRVALDDLHKNATAENAVNDCSGGPAYWRHQIQGVFDITVYYTPGEGYDGSLKFTLAESSTF